MSVCEDMFAAVEARLVRLGFRPVAAVASEGRSWDVDFLGVPCRFSLHLARNTAAPGVLDHALCLPNREVVLAAALPATAGKKVRALLDETVLAFWDRATQTRMLELDARPA